MHKSNSDAYPQSKGHWSILSSFPYTNADVSTPSYDFEKSMNDCSLVALVWLSAFLKQHQSFQLFWIC